MRKGKIKGKCGMCNAEIEWNTIRKVYCEECRIKRNQFRSKLITTIKEKNALGTMDISPHIAIKKDGKPDFRAEEKIIKNAKKYIFYWGNFIKFHRGWYECHGYNSKEGFVY